MLFHLSIDINECETSNDLCRPFEMCINRPGDFVCEPKIRCEYGYQLNSNGTECIGELSRLNRETDTRAMAAVIQPTSAA